jgi:hypothetical protein|tara:strand:- start:435 stop:611 length:177 start_codon:yes stop_codon:yes gene_type:complete
MAKKDKKEVSSEEVKEEAPVEESQPESKVEERKIRKKIEGIGYTNIVYDNGEIEKKYH